MDDLERLVDVSARTIRYYTGIGLLPPPDERGRYAYYSDDHLQRLRLIKRLKDVDLHLGTIKRYVDTMTIGQIEALLVGPQATPPPAAPLAPAAARAKVSDRPAPSDDAGAYIARVLAAQREARMVQDRQSSSTPAPAVAPLPRVRQSQPSAAWDHYVLAPGIELNVRHDAASEWQSELDQLLAAAKELFKRRSQ